MSSAMQSSFSQQPSGMMGKPFFSGLDFALLCPLMLNAFNSLFGLQVVSTPLFIISRVLEQRLYDLYLQLNSIFMCVMVIKPSNL